MPQLDANKNVGVQSSNSPLSEQAFATKEPWELKKNLSWEELSQRMEALLQESGHSDLERAWWSAELAFAQLKLSQDYAPDTIASQYFAEQAAQNALYTLTSNTAADREDGMHIRTAKKVYLSLKSQSDMVFVDEKIVPDKMKTSIKELLDLAQRSGADSCSIFFPSGVAGQYLSASYLGNAIMMSSTKSVAACLIKIAEERGLLSIDDPVHKYFPEKLITDASSSIAEKSSYYRNAAPCRWDEGQKAKVTIRHLLTHTSGLPGNNYCNEQNMPQNLCQQFTDYDTACAALPLIRAPAKALTQQSSSESNFDYSNAGCQLLAVVMATAANKLGMTVPEFAAKFLFGPLGMMDTRLATYDGVHVKFDAELISTPSDFSVLGRMMLNGGLANDAQVLSRQGVEELLTTSDKYFEGGASNCGHLWWINEWGFSAEGYLDNSMYIIPSVDAVVVRTQDWPPQSESFIAERDRILGSLHQNA